VNQGNKKLNYNLDFLSYHYLKGIGIEIGALDNPFPLYNKVKKCYYIDLDLPFQLKIRYPERKGKILVNIKGDGSTLHFIKKESLDFIIALQFIEHVANPIGTIINHLERLKPNGILLYSIPDKRYTFDKKRKLTSLEHLIKEHEENKNFLEEHYIEWIEKVENITQKKQKKERLEFLKKTNFPIHFHTFIPESFLEIISYLSFQKKLHLYPEILLHEQDFFLIVLCKKPSHKIISSYIGSLWHKEQHKIKVLEKALKECREDAKTWRETALGDKEHIQNLEKEIALAKSHIANLEYKLSLISR